MPDIAYVLKEYTDEVNAAAGSFFTWKSINDLAARESKVLWALNKSALTWNVVVYSLQVTFFIALGRIFDRDSRSLTIYTLLSECAANLQQFTRGALEKRRVDEAHGQRPEYLDDYLKGVYEAKKADFDALEQVAKAYTDAYRRVYEPIRHKVIAHKDLAIIGSKDALFARTKIGEIQEMLEFLHQTHRVIWELYHNGRLTALADHQYAEGERYKSDVEQLLRQHLS